MDINLKARQLSGGNLQKVVVARELFKRPKLVIAEQPSQGLDIAATREVWKYLVDARQDAGVLLLTGDLKEALTLADTISVIFKGEIIITFNARDKEKVENIGMYIAGIRESKKRYTPRSICSELKSPCQESIFSYKLYHHYMLDFVCRENSQVYHIRLHPFQILSPNRDRWIQILQ